MYQPYTPPYRSAHSRAVATTVMLSVCAFVSLVSLLLAVVLTVRAPSDAESLENDPVGAFLMLFSVTLLFLQIFLFLLPR